MGLMGILDNLMASFQQGNMDAFSELVSRIELNVFNLTKSILRHRQDAEEVTQDVFLKLYKAKNQYDPTKKLMPWILSISSNAAKDRLRRKKVLSIFREFPEGINDIDAAKEEVVSLEEDKLLYELNNLSNMLKDTLNLKYIKGKTNQEVSKELGISVTKVKECNNKGKAILYSRLRA